MMKHPEAVQLFRSVVARRSTNSFRSRIRPRYSIAVTSKDFVPVLKTTSNSSNCCHSIVPCVASSVLRRMNGKIPIKFYNHDRLERLSNYQTFSTNAQAVVRSNDDVDDDEDFDNVQIQNHNFSVGKGNECNNNKDSKSINETYQRTIVYQAISDCLRNDIEWRNFTLKILFSQSNLSSLSSTTIQQQKQIVDGMNHKTYNNQQKILSDNKYQSMYYDSIISFMKLMATNPPKELKNAIDQLIQQLVKERLFQKLPKNENHRSKKVDFVEQSIFENATKNVMSVVCIVFADHIKERHYQKLEQYKDLESKTDLTRPQEWFLPARLDKRKIIYHGGPTNSGKTYEALERLKKAKRGMYLGPLRLLAAEVYEKLTAAGVYCNLITGQERREIPFATHGSATIEIANVFDDYGDNSVVVIDEIQMIADDERGYAWTRALLGSRCKEIHVCGGLEAVDIVKRIAEACGDEFELRTYVRFTDLIVSETSLASKPDQPGSYRHVKPGDCVVAFSRNDIFAIKREIETTTKYKCCVIYGSLPPSTRTEQAKRFNDPDSGYDILVASDAIGMGLNLNIKRIIFNTIFKEDKSSVVRLSHSAIKQISGRAGRRNSPFPVGEVTTRDPRDLPYIRQCLMKDISAINKAGLLPTASHIDIFRLALETYGLEPGGKHLHDILLQFSEMASLKSDYFLCRQTDIVRIASKLAPLDLSVRDKYVLCLCPIDSTSLKGMRILLGFASKVASGEVAGVMYNVIPKKVRTFEDLSSLCNTYLELDLFLWLQKQFPPKNIMEEQNAVMRKELAIKLIGKALEETDKLKLDHSYIRRDQKLRQIWESSKQDD